MLSWCGTSDYAYLLVLMPDTFALRTRPKCRYLHSNQLTGTLPSAWSALVNLGWLWVPRSLPIHCFGRGECNRTALPASSCALLGWMPDYTYSLVLIQLGHLIGSCHACGRHTCVVPCAIAVIWIPTS
jgi:hypothetical protein